MEKVSELFRCICCQELLYQPITTPCAHNFCKVHHYSAVLRCALLLLKIVFIYSVAMVTVALVVISKDGEQE